MKKLKKIIENPRISIMWLLEHLSWIPDSTFVKLLYFAETGKKINLANPTLLNEKLQWLKLYNRKPEYSLMCDKLRVKDYIAKQIGEEHVIKTLGVWDKAEDVDFSKLPNRFVIKVNHTSGFGNYICKDKSQMDEAKVRKILSDGLKRDFYKYRREWPYKNIDRKIFAEEFMENADGTEIVDYKFYCYGGKPRYFMYSVGEANHHVRNCKFDMDCNNIDHLFKKKRALSDDEMKLPENFAEMKAIVEKLCVGYPHIRIDLYNIDGKIYFGEMTFYSGAGFINIDNEEFSNKLASYIDLSKIK